MDQELKGILTDLVQAVGGINQRLDGIEKRLDAMDRRMDGIEKRLDNVEKRLDNVEKRLDNVEKRLDNVEMRLDTVDKRLDGVDRRLDETYSIVKALREYQEISIAQMDNFDHQKATFEYVDEVNAKMDERVTRLEQKMAAS